MANKQTTLDDIAESIADLTTMVAAEFTAVRQEMATKAEMNHGFTAVRQEMATKAEMNHGFTAVRQEMATKAEMNRGFAAVRSEMATKLEMNHGFTTIRREMATKEATQAGFDRLAGDAKAHYEDIKELYRMIDEFRRDLDSLTTKERVRFANLEDFADRVAAKTGIPFRA